MKIKFECKCGLTHHLEVGTKEYACRFCEDPYTPATAENATATVKAPTATPFPTAAVPSSPAAPIIPPATATTEASETEASDALQETK